MRKIYVLVFCIIAITSYGQFSENFDSSTNLPPGWVSFKGTNGLGDNSFWEIVDYSYHSASNGAHVHYEAVSGGLAEDWLVTPLINLTNRTNCSLSFYGAESYPAFDYGTIYEVKVSTTSQTNITSFTNIATFGETDFGYSQPLSNLKTIDLSYYNGQQIYIAFVMRQNDGDNWSIDDVNVTGTLGTTEFENNLNLTASPNPTKDFIYITTPESIEKIDVYDILGKIVKTNNKNNNVDLTELSKGLYILKIATSDGIVTTKKVVKI